MAYYDQDSDELREAAGYVIQTADKVWVKVGDRVYNYYDCWWGVIQDDVDSEGWFHLRRDDGKLQLLNGERISSKEYPRG